MPYWKITSIGLTDKFNKYKSLYKHKYKCSLLSGLLCHRHFWTRYKYETGCEVRAKYKR